MAIVVPDIACLREPNLLIPGKKYIGNVSLIHDSECLKNALSVWAVSEKGGSTVRDHLNNFPASLSTGATWNKGGIEYASTYGAFVPDDIYMGGSGVNDIYGLALVFEVFQEYNSSSAYGVLVNTFGEYSTTGNKTLGIGSYTSQISGETIIMTGTSNNRTAIKDTITKGKHSLVVFWDSSASHYRFILDGVERTTYSASSNASLQSRVSGTEFRIGVQTAHNINGAVEQVIYYNAEIGAQQAKELSKDPFKIWTPA